MKITYESNRIKGQGLYQELFQAAKNVLKHTPLEEWSEWLDAMETIVAEIEVIIDE